LTQGEVLVEGLGACSRRWLTKAWPLCFKLLDKGCHFAADLGIIPAFEFQSSTQRLETVVLCPPPIRAICKLECARGQNNDAWQCRKYRVDFFGPRTGSHSNCRCRTSRNCNGKQGISEKVVDSGSQGAPTNTGLQVIDECHRGVFHIVVKGRCLQAPNVAANRQPTAGAAGCGLSG